MFSSFFKQQLCRFTHDFKYILAIYLISFFTYSDTTVTAILLDKNNILVTKNKKINVLELFHKVELKYQELEKAAFIKSDKYNCKIYIIQNNNIKNTIKIPIQKILKSASKVKKLNFPKDNKHKSYFISINNNSKKQNYRLNRKDMIILAEDFDSVKRVIKIFIN